MRELSRTVREMNLIDARSRSAVAHERHLNEKVEDLVATAVEATAYANAHPDDRDAQQVANACADAALAGRQLRDLARYGD